jgi:hypothetical protein
MKAFKILALLLGMLTTTYDLSYSEHGLICHSSSMILVIHDNMINGTNHIV